MKRTILLLLTFLFLTTSVILSQENTEDETPTNSPTKTPTDKIKELKDRVANRVAELKKEKLNGISGSLKSSSDAAFILTVNNIEYSIQLEEEGKVYSVDSFLRKKEAKLSSLVKNAYLTVIGTINNDDKTAVAKVVIARDPVKHIFGVVLEVSSKDGTISVTGNDNKNYIVDIEVTTKINTYDPNKDLITKIGLSKIETGSRIHVYGSLQEKENQLTGIRILIIPKTESTPKITPTVTPVKES